MVATYQSKGPDGSAAELFRRLGFPFVHCVMTPKEGDEEMLILVRSRLGIDASVRSELALQRSELVHVRLAANDVYVGRSKHLLAVRRALDFVPLLLPLPCGQFYQLTALWEDAGILRAVITSPEQTQTFETLEVLIRELPEPELPLVP